MAAASAVLLSAAVLCSRSTASGPPSAASESSSSMCRTCPPLFHMMRNRRSSATLSTRAETMVSRLLLSPCALPRNTNTDAFELLALSSWYRAQNLRGTCHEALMTGSSGSWGDSSIGS
eukprot:Amastigsp_a510086_10.p4 type:complete len:119 gc:universal Amastigsp_a510086_10:581-225(-)